MIQKLLVLYCLLIILLTAPPVVLASDEFEINHQITYLYNDTGLPLVRHQVDITNLLTAVFPKSYSLQIRGDQIDGVKAYDTKGQLSFEKKNSSQQTTEIVVNLTNPQAGKGKTTTFFIEYPGPPAKKTGQVWDIILPKLSEQTADDKISVNLIVPKSFGNPAYISPGAQRTEITDNGKAYQFDGTQIKNSGIAAGFGNFQTLDFKLTYHLTNQTKSSSTEQIALPPDTYLQRVFYDSLTPKPQSVTVDQDGNWLANYKLQPQQSLSIEARGQAHLLSSPVNPSIYQPARDTLKNYLKPANFWQSDHPTIKNAAAQLDNPKEIFDFTVDKLQYDPSRALNNPQRKGALSALEDPLSSLCTEFTDLFIALARADNIPAREHQGYALQTDPLLQPLSLKNDILHAWPEYWDDEKRIWRAVDPTWTDTSGGINYFETVALSHFTFVIHGIDPTKPAPAGFYKTAADQKTVDVKVGNYKDYLGGSPQIDIHLPLQLLPFINQTGYIKITNTNAYAMYDVPIKLTQTQIPLKLEPTSLSVLPPYASVEVPFTVSSPLIPVQTNKRALFSIYGYTISYSISESKFFALYALIVITSLFGFICLAFFAVKAWHLHIQKRLGQDNLRR